MPELPEVETIARELSPVLTGAVIASAVVARRDVVHGTARSLSRVLPGRRIVRVSRRAKRLVFELNPQGSLTFHLGMSGRITLDQPGSPMEPHTHFRLRFQGVAQELRFRDPRRFGGVWFDDPTERAQYGGRRLGPLGIEPLDAKPAAFRLLLERTRQVKALLLDQTVIAGLGNIYCDESLHRAGVHPRTAGATLDTEAADRLLRAIKSVLRSAIRHNGTTLMDYRTTNGTPGSFQSRHRVYHREGAPCRACSTIIVRSIVAGRSTFHCPVCQPEARDGRARSPQCATVRLRHPKRGRNGAKGRA